MKVTAQDLKQHYQNVSDDELLDLDRESLSEAARQCYDEEMARRQLSAGAGSGGEDEEAAEKEGVDPDIEVALDANPVPVAVFPAYEDAQLARNLLRSSEIPSDISGCTLLVSQSEADLARDLLLPQIQDANKIVVKNWIEHVWNEGEDADNDELATAAMVAELRSKRPGLHVTVDDMIAEGDRVAARLSLDTTLTGMMFVRLNLGRIVEAWYNLDPL
jgi:predicted ester cyclase